MVCLGGQLAVTRHFAIALQAGHALEHLKRGDPMYLQTRLVNNITQADIALDLKSLPTIRHLWPTVVTTEAWHFLGQSWKYSLPAACAWARAGGTLSRCQNGFE